MKAQGESDGPDMTPDEARKTLVDPVARIIYKDYEECGDEFVSRVWDNQNEVPEFAVTVEEFESTARKVLDYLLAEREALIVALGGRPVARGSSFSDTWHGCHDEDREAWVVPDE